MIIYPLAMFLLPTSIIKVGPNTRILFPILCEVFLEGRTVLKLYGSALSDTRVWGEIVLWPVQEDICSL